jgi:hypothetical protein
MSTLGPKISITVTVNNSYDYVISNKLKLEVSITVTVNNSYDYIISNKLKLEVSITELFTVTVMSDF